MNYNVVLIAAVEQSDSIVYMCSSSDGKASACNAGDSCRPGARPCNLCEMQGVVLWKPLYPRVECVSRVFVGKGTW